MYLYTIADKELTLISPSSWKARWSFTVNNLQTYNILCQYLSSEKPPASEKVALILWRSIMRIVPSLLKHWYKIPNCCMMSNSVIFYINKWCCLCDPLLLSEIILKPPKVSLQWPTWYFPSIMKQRIIKLLREDS